MKRRDFLKTGVIALGAVPFVQVFGRREAYANVKSWKLAPGIDDFKSLDEAAKKAPQSKNFGYYKNRSKVDEKAFPKAKADGKSAFCENCVLWMKAQEDTRDGQKYGGCSLFMGAQQLVAAEGWCNTYSKRPG